MLVSHVKRVVCERCSRPQTTCICNWIRPTANVVEVVVLQHPLEALNTKGSARLLNLSLQRSRLWVEEVFALGALHALLHDPFDADADADADSTSASDVKQAILLYPNISTDAAVGVSTPPILPSETLRDPSRLRLIVLDGTWRKSRKLLHLNPLLQQLPRLSLRDVPASRYLIRKAHRADQLSTLEATCLALGQLEGNADRFQPLLDAFDGFISQQLAQRDAGIDAVLKSEKI
jgi:DTW domain-containing protein